MKLARRVAMVAIVGMAGLVLLNLAASAILTAMGFAP